jgi:secreted trypsin-like serine protease
VLAAVTGLIAMAPAYAQDQRRVKPFIVGGTTADIKNFSYQVGLRITRGDNEYRCGGSIIDPYWVLTAAHCFYDGNQPKTNPDNVEMLTGDNTFSSDKMVVTKARQVIIHPKYNQTTHSNDIALIQTTAALTGTPIALHETFVWLPAPTGDATVTGWGNTSYGAASPSDVLMQATIPLVPNDTCNAADSYNGKVEASMLCAGYAEGGKSACHGDSGGPLVQIRDGNRVQIGVVNWSEGCAAPKKYEVFARVSSHRDWINEKIHPYQPEPKRMEECYPSPTSNTPYYDC